MKEEKKPLPPPIFMWVGVLGLWLLTLAAALGLSEREQREQVFAGLLFLSLFFTMLALAATYSDEL